MKKSILLVASMVIGLAAYSQVGIGTTAPHASAVLELVSTTKGFLPPRVSADTDIAGPAEGLVIYDKSDNCLNVWDSTEWIDLCAGGTTTTTTPTIPAGETIFESYLKSSDTYNVGMVADDQFGTDISISDDGTIIATSAIGIGTMSGFVVIHELVNGYRVLKQRIQAPTPSIDDKFGKSIKLSADGQTLAIGAPNDFRSTTATGSVYIYKKDTAGVFILKTTLSVPWTSSTVPRGNGTSLTTASINPIFGWSLDLSSDGKTLIIGAPYHSNTLYSEGGAYIYEETSTNVWSSGGLMLSPTPDGTGSFGWSNSISGDGNTIVIGAINEGSSGAATFEGVGICYIYKRVSSTWTLYETLLAPAPTERFGRPTINYDGTVIAIGSNGGAQDIEPGVVHVYTHAGATYSTGVKELKNANFAFTDLDSYQSFGSDLSINNAGDTLIIGARGDRSGTARNTDDISLDGSGAAYVFTYDSATTSWVQDRYIKAPNRNFADQFNTNAISGDGKTFAVGSTLEDSNDPYDMINNQSVSKDSGAIFVYKL